MAQYTGHKPKWKWKVGVPKGGPLTRPPQGAPYNPIRGTPGMGGGPLLERPGKQIDLSPKDYKWIDPAPQKWGSPAYRRAMNAAARGARFARMLKLFGPVGRAMTLLGEPMDLFQTTHLPGTQPYDFIAHGWNVRSTCPAGVTCDVVTHITGRWGCGLLNPSQFATVQANYPVTTRSAETWYGPTVNGGPSQCEIATKNRYRSLILWERPAPAPAPDVPTLTEPIPGPTQPMPADLAPPAPAFGPQTHQPRKPPPAKAPPYVVDGHPMVPDKPGRKKWKPSRQAVADIYGGLTEIADAMDCAEKAMYGKVQKGPLQDRMMELAQDLADRPKDFRTLSFLKCMVVNNLSDAVIGKANKLANRITKSPYWVRPTGVGAGSWAARMR